MPAAEMRNEATGGGGALVVVSTVVRLRVLAGAGDKVIPKCL